jgi:alpha-tubulin suppressor-like RCC1 family protein
VSCWGDNSNGQLGDGLPAVLEPYRSQPVAVVNIANAVSVSVGYQHSCALRATGTVACWGVAGELGNGKTTGSASPVAVTGLKGVVDLAAGGNVNFNGSCAVVSGGGVECWGTTAVPVPGLPSASAVSVGGGADCALLSASGVDCWGYNVYGQLGDGTSTSSSTPVMVEGLP